MAEKSDKLLMLWSSGGYGVTEQLKSLGAEPVHTGEKLTEALKTR